MAIRMLRDLHEVARSANLRVTEIDGWQDRTRPASTGGFAPQGVLVHHTGGLGNSIETAKWLAKVGRPEEGIPAPLAHLALNRDGIVYVLAAGRANHAGDIEAVRPWLDAGDGNAQLVGIEAMNTGAEGWTDDQYDAYVRLCAALCEAYGWPAAHVLGHKEVAPDRKVDPGKMNMERFRQAVQQRMTTTDGGENPMPDETPVWQRKIKRLDEVGPGDPEEIPAGQMLAQTHNRAEDARAHAGAAATSAGRAVEAASEARRAALEARDSVAVVGDDVGAAVRMAREARDAARAARDAITEGSWGFEPADQEQAGAEARQAFEAAADGTPIVLESEPDAEVEAKRRRRRRKGKSMRPREYRKATRAAVVPSAIGVLGLLWQNGWDLGDLTETQVSVLIAAASSGFAVVFGTANGEPDDA